MLSLARQHALDRVQFGRPIASFQAVRHRLAETLVAIEGAEATLNLPGEDNPDLTALLAKAAAGKAALTAAKHCQQVLGGIGFTAEHDLHHHVKRVLVLDGLLGSSRELTQGAERGCGPAARRRGSPTSEGTSPPRACVSAPRHAAKLRQFAHARVSLSVHRARFIHSFCRAAFRWDRVRSNIPIWTQHCSGCSMIRAEWRRVARFWPSFRDTTSNQL